MALLTFDIVDKEIHFVRHLKKICKRYETCCFSKTLVIWKKWFTQWLNNIGLRDASVSKNHIVPVDPTILFISHLFKEQETETARDWDENKFGALDS